MKPPKRNRRLLLSLAALSAVALGMVLIITALGQNTQFFRNPSDVVARVNVVPDQDYRVGGIIVPGTVEELGGLKVRFNVRDFEDVKNAKLDELTVAYDGVLPDLFQEGQGVVAVGVLDEDGIFQARTVLAKHDENYAPPMPDAAPAS